MDNNAMIKYTGGSLDTIKASEYMLRSGFFSNDIKDVSQAIVKILAGQEVGLGPVASVMGIYIVKGKISFAAATMAALIKKSRRYDYRVLEHTAEACKIEFFEIADGKRASLGVSAVTMAEARAGKWDSDWDKEKNDWKPKQTWRSFPRNMLWARAMSNGAKWYTPDIFSSPVYTPEELGAETDEEGNVIEGQVREVPAQPAQPEPAVNLDGLKRELRALRSEEKQIASVLGATVPDIHPEMSADSLAAEIAACRKRIEAHKAEIAKVESQAA